MDAVGLWPQTEAGEGLISIDRAMPVYAWWRDGTGMIPIDQEPMMLARSCRPAIIRLHPSLGFRQPHPCRQTGNTL